MRGYNALLKIAFSSFSSYETENQIHVTKSIGELLFDGYDDPFITMGNVVPLINTIPGYDKFGWFYNVGVKVPSSYRNVEKYCETSS